MFGATVKGYLIPKGWKVMPLFRNIHHNPEFHPSPHNFDPSRFEVRYDAEHEFAHHLVKQILEK